MWRDHACEHLAPQGLAQKIVFGSDRVYFPPGVPTLGISGTGFNRVDKQAGRARLGRVLGVTTDV